MTATTALVITLIMTTVTPNGSGVAQTITTHENIAQCDAVRIYLEANNRVYTPDNSKSYNVVKKGQCIEQYVPVAP